MTSEESESPQFEWVKRPVGMAAVAGDGLASALSAFQAEVPIFHKSKTAGMGQYSYKYADLGDILPVVGPLLAKHGLSWSSKPGVLPDGTLVLDYRLLHASGEADAGTMPLGVDRNCKPQALGSAITYARRYAITAQLNLATDEDDDGTAAQAASRARAAANGTPPEPERLPQPLIDELAAARKAAKVDERWLRMQLIAVGAQDVPDPITVKTITHLTRSQASGLLDALNAHIEAKAGQA